MTLTATYTVQAVDTYASPTFAFTSPVAVRSSAQQSLRSASPQSTRSGHSRTQSGNARITLNPSAHSRESLGMASDADNNTSPWTPSGAQTSWLKRLSTYSSRTSSQPPSPQPEAAATTPERSASVAPSSHAVSLAPLLSAFTPPSVGANKLVKRSSSLREAHSSPIQSASSRLPLPAFRMPVTSHERQASLLAHEHVQQDSGQEASSDVQWRNYFTPKVSADATNLEQRRSSTGIPNPIRRICPDRNYRPTLLSAGEAVGPSQVEVDAEAEEVDEREEQEVESARQLPPASAHAASVVSSPLLKRTPSIAKSSKALPSRTAKSTRSKTGLGSAEKAHAESRKNESDSGSIHSSSSASRSFSKAAGLPSSGDEKWKRLSTSRLSASKYQQKEGRATPGSPASMGNRQSVAAAEDSDHSSKRREIPSQQPSQKWTSSPRVPGSPLNEIQLNVSSPNGRSVPLPSSKPSVRHGSNHAANTANTTNTTLQESRVLPSPVSFTSVSRPSRGLSASTAAGSEGDDQLKDGFDGLDSRSDTLYDSIRTGRTRNSSGVTGTTAATDFDDSPPVFAQGKLAHSKDSFRQSTLSSTARQSVIEEEEDMITPSKSTCHEAGHSSPSFRFHTTPTIIPSSPPAMPGMAEDEDSWSFGDDYNLPAAHTSLKSRFPQIELDVDMLSPSLKPQASSPTANTSHQASNTTGDKDARSCIFDWSEQQPHGKSPAGRSPPRPKTVHGKKDAENRGSRTVGRRGPSGVHARSQSVPVAPEVDGKRAQVVTNKFGTWGVGSKGVTEDWNEDFDFGEALPTIPPPLDPVEEKRLDSGIGMFVPKAIREQQQNVLANIGLLRDWGLLIEELKELRKKAVLLNLLSGKQREMWNEMDAMIDLADQESDDRTLAPRTSPPSSPSFDYDEFEDRLPVPSPLRLPAAKTVFEDDVFDASSASSSPMKGQQGLLINPATPRRPRKDSEAVAKSVIEALQSRRNVSDPGLGGAGAAPAKKVPFDTATLRRIVPYVQDMREKVKRSIREAEGLDTSPSPRVRDGDPLFSRVFNEQTLPDSPASGRKKRRSTATTDHMLSDEHSSRSPPDGLSARMKMMAMV